MIAAVQEARLSAPPPPPAIGPGLLLAGDPLAGQLFIQDQVRCGQTTGLFDDVVGRGWTLLSPTCDPATQLDPELAAFFASIGGISAHVAADAPIADVNGSYAKWFATAGKAVVLQRPDFYVFGTASAVDGTAQLVGTLRRLLAAP
jgi:hypothetical protein